MPVSGVDVPPTIFEVIFINPIHSNEAMFAIVCSNLDKAGMNIKHNLVRLFQFKETGEEFEGSPVLGYGHIKLFTTSKDSIHCDGLESSIKSELIVFATKHRSQVESRTLSVHVPGNWDAAELGGRPKSLCIAPPLYMKSAILALKHLAEGSSYDVTLEVTHHGPYLEKTPCFFIEIGSTEAQWTDANAGEIIARAIIQCLTSKLKADAQPCIGIGGGHYAPYFNKIMLMDEYAIGHICPKYASGTLNQDMIKQAAERTVPKPELVLLDWKGLGTEKQVIVKWIEALGLKPVQARKIGKD